MTRVLTILVLMLRRLWESGKEMAGYLKKTLVGGSNGTADTIWAADV